MNQQNLFNNQNQFQQFNNMNPQQNFPQMSPQQMQQIQMAKAQAYQLGLMLKKQKELQEKIDKLGEREINKEEEIILFFNHNYNILPITMKFGDSISEALNKYMTQTNNNSARFFFNNKEYTINSYQSLYEIEGLMNGSEIKVQ